MSNHPEKRQDGMDYEYALSSLLKCGSVPYEMYPYYDEMPGIRDKVFASVNFDELERESEKTKFRVISISLITSKSIAMSIGCPLSKI